jgi:GTPase
MIKDEIKVKFIAGNGGDGGVKFGQGTPKRPMGGIGGDGGNVYVEGTTDLFDYGYINEEFNFKAENGDSGGVNAQRGRNGNDLIIRVPLVTDIYDEDGNLIVSIKERGQKVLLLKGGQGGLGNHYYRKGVNGRYDYFKPGKEGESLKALMKLKLVSDIVFIGFPNAGKSSMINALTRANVKVGNYPFTTLSPHLGRMNGITLLDLPGLIEGTHMGKGLGTGFIKHTEYARLVAHFISLESENLLKDYLTMRNELKFISEDLYNKPEIIVLTKADLFEPEEIEEKIKSLKDLASSKVVVSAWQPELLLKLQEEFRSKLNR